jgi:hypothetical protein
MKRISREEKPMIPLDPKRPLKLEEPNPYLAGRRFLPGSQNRVKRRIFLIVWISGNFIIGISRQKS